MRKENKNWIILDKKVLRFGDLSGYQRKSEGLSISPTEAYLKLFKMWRLWSRIINS
ncbi:MAG: hypothetical protein I3275_03100 [Candidatus Moeniiplasma glomeromycotorum]|nr:hypothetical protein [Candidatus Moeniiplasma glomeromycotorum]